MRFSVQSNEQGIALVRLNGRTVWTAPVNAGVTDFSLEAVSGPKGEQSIHCDWIEHYVGDRTEPEPPFLEAVPARLSGRVLWFNDAKGYGFIEAAGVKDHIWAHFSEVEMAGFRTLVEGATVTFELAKTEKGPTAKKIKTVSV